MSLKDTYQSSAQNHQAFVLKAKEALQRGVKLSNHNHQRIIVRSRDAVLSQVNGSSTDLWLLDNALDLIYQVSRRGYGQEALASLVEISKAFSSTIESNKVQAFYHFSETVRDVLVDSSNAYNNQMEAEFSQSRSIVEGANPGLASQIEESVAEMRDAVTRAIKFQAARSRGTLDVTQLGRDGPP